MVEKKKSSQRKVKDVVFRVVRATLKALLVYLLYFLLAPYLAPIAALVPGIMETIELFIMVYVVLMILGDLMARTIFQYFFSTAMSLFVIAYLLLSMGDGRISMDFDNFSLMLNLTLFYAIATLLSLLGLAISILQAINFLSERAEGPRGIQT